MLEPAAAPRLNVRLTEAAAPVLPSPAPRLEVLRPNFGELIALHDAGQYQIGLELSGFTPTVDGQGVLISLDGRRPRRWTPDTVLRLEDLIAEDESIEPGAHVLFGVLVDNEGSVFRSPGPSGPSPFFVLDFFVGQPTALTVAKTSRIFCVGPVGTFYGDQGAALRLDLVAIGAPNASARLRIAAPPAADWFAEIDPHRPYLIAGLPLGDVRVFAELGTGSSASCESTINPAVVMRGP